MKPSGRPPRSRLQSVSILRRHSVAFTTNISDDYLEARERTQYTCNNFLRLAAQLDAFVDTTLRYCMCSRYHFLALHQPIHENWDTQLGDELDEIGDPPRVWLNSLDQPGCAFTRQVCSDVSRVVAPQDACTSEV